MNKATKKILLHYLLAPSLMLLLLWLIYRQLGRNGDLSAQWQSLLANWQRGNALALAIVLALAPINWMLEAVKWKMLLQKIQPLPYPRALASTLTGTAFALVTPNKVGDFAGRILYLRNSNKLRAAIAVLISNLSQTLVTYFFGIVGLVFFSIRYRSAWAFPVLMLALVSAALLAFLYLRIDLVARWAEGRKCLRKIVISIRVVKRYSRRDLWLLMAVACIRFVVYNFQFVLLANVSGAGLPWAEGLLLSALMFWMITVIPSIFLADLGVRGFVAGLLFTDTGLTHNSVAILAGSYLIWLLNLVLPAIMGSALVLSIRFGED
ncbi:MAG: lysylphosphatidylglycerol synthase domain-containing protein [Edaphocola sp.]